MNDREQPEIELERELANLPNSGRPRARSARSVCRQFQPMLRKLRDEGKPIEAMAEVISKKVGRTIKATTLEVYISQGGSTIRPPNKTVYSVVAKAGKALARRRADVPEVQHHQSPDVGQPTPSADVTKSAPPLPEQQRSDEPQPAKSPGSTRPAGTLRPFSEL